MPSAGEKWWLAEIDGKAMGFACFKDTGYRTVYLARAGVLPAARGHGLYRRMIRAGLAHFRKLGFTDSVSDCTNFSVESARGLMATGYKPFWPANPWGLPCSVYWHRRLT